MHIQKWFNKATAHVMLSYYVHVMAGGEFHEIKSCGILLKVHALVKSHK